MLLQILSDLFFVTCIAFPIDLDTGVLTVTRLHDGNKNMKLVMSDEFNVEGRSFGKDQDLFLEAISKPDMSNDDMLQFCKLKYLIFFYLSLFKNLMALFILI